MGAALLTVFGGTRAIPRGRGWSTACSLIQWNQQNARKSAFRMAHGLAQSGRILKAWSWGKGMRLAIAGLTLGILIALAATRVLSSLLFGVSAHDPLIFVGRLGNFWRPPLSSLATSPARRATRVDPLVGTAL